ncbi:MAG: hypothetical protein RI907_1169 [Pseudomonadota bacterium]
MTTFLYHLAITALSLGAASRMVPGVRFQTWGDLFLAALLLGLVNAVLKPALVLLTFPLSLLTFGLFVLVINGLMVMLVAALVRGFELPGFWSAFFTGIIVSVLSLFLHAVLNRDGPAVVPLPHLPSAPGTWT